MALGSLFIRVGNLTATLTAPQKWQYHSFFYTLETHEHIGFLLANTVDVVFECGGGIDLPVAPKPSNARTSDWQVKVSGSQFRFLPHWFSGRGALGAPGGGAVIPN